MTKQQLTLYIIHKLISIVLTWAVVSQFFVTEAENEYVIRANSAIMKCKIPSFVSEFVYVDQWIADDGTIYRHEDQDYGKSKQSCHEFLIKYCNK